MTTFLLDVNVLIALIDAEHVQHRDAHDWFGRIGHRSFATCPITENGLLRVVGHPRYPASPGTPAAVAPSLATLTASPGHVFWNDDISLLDNQWVDASRLLHHSQMTDTYLLALAAARGGQLATLDRRLVTDAVRTGAAALHLI